MMRVVVFDVDGTVVLHAGRPNYDDSRCLLQAERNEAVCRLIRDLVAAGADVRFLTGRKPGLHRMTSDQVAWATGIRRPVVYTRSTDFWQGWAGYIQEKAQCLARITRETGHRGTYVDDQDAGRQIAAHAGWVFLHATSAATGVPLLGVTL